MIDLVASQIPSIHVNACVMGRLKFFFGDLIIKINNDNVKVCYF